MRQSLGKLGRAALFAVTAMGVFAASAARADIVSDQSAAILIYPKIVVDTNGVFTDGRPTNTVLQLTNTSNSVVAARCVFVDTTSRCDGDGIACTAETAAARCGSTDRCIQRWVPRDFRMTLTKRQPIAWDVSAGMLQFPCESGGCPFGQSNTSADGFPSAIPPVADDPFFGELKCVQVDPETFEPAGGLNPANGGRGDLAGLATIVEISDGAPDARKYNAIGIQATGTNDNNDTLQIGGDNAEYNACPASLILNHVFDDAQVTSNGTTSTVTTDLTVIPCSEDLGSEGGGNSAVLQFLIFNEFEQRFSASERVDCWAEIQLSDIDSRPGPFGDAQSVFNVGVQGTITGQTRIRPVAGPNSANAVLAVAEEFWSGPGGRQRTDAANVHFIGAATGGDQIILHADGIVTP